tara:strand:+ start:226 stop:756 length:531 start_codon:yes stop_codon:yes gene_type:complete
MKKNKEVGFLYGDLLNFPYGINTIAHCCNILNVMGAGIAEQIAKRYPEAKEADDVAEKAGRNDLGDFSFAEIEISNDNNFPHQEFGKDIRKCEIYNLYTIESLGPGREINYEALYRNLHLMRNRLNNNPDCVLGLPFGMGCGLAGGNWGIVSAMINAIFASPGTYFPTYIVKLEIE